MDYDNIISAQIYNHNKLTSQGYNYQPDTSRPDSSGVDYFFQQESPYKYPPLIICDDSKRVNQSADVIQKYMDVITDECGNRFNIRNLNSCAGDLQAGYSANIDLDSHLKNINYYADRCYYDNWKLAPNSEVLFPCNGLKRNAQILVPDYRPVGRHYEDCLGTSNTAAAGMSSACWNSPPTDFNLASPDIRQRYDFGKSYNKFQTANCLRESERKLFPRGDAPPLESLKRVPGHGRQDARLLDSINRGIQHDFYKFFESSQCVVYPNQRLFNNITKRSMLPNAHFRNSDPVYRA
jgi:hypothetical protein